MLSHFFVAHSSNVRSAVETGSPDPAPCLAVWRVDPVKLSTLAHALTGNSTEVSDPELELSSEGPWVFRLAENTVAALARLSDDDLPCVARKWAQTAEWQLDHATPEGLEWLLRHLRSLACAARESDSNLYLRVDL